MLNVFMNDVNGKIRQWGLDAVYSMYDGDEAVNLSGAIKSLCCMKGINVKDARRRIADKLIEENMYKF